MVVAQQRDYASGSNKVPWHGALFPPVGRYLQLSGRRNEYESDDDCVKTNPLKLKRRGAKSELNTGEEHETS
jgi:hypothetical protein